MSDPIRGDLAQCLRMAVADALRQEGHDELAEQAVRAADLLDREVPEIFSVTSRYSITRGIDGAELDVRIHVASIGVPARQDDAPIPFPLRVPIVLKDGHRVDLLTHNLDMIVEPYLRLETWNSNPGTRR